MFHPAQIANEHETQKLPSFYSTSPPLPPLLSALPSLSPPSFLAPLPSLLLLLAVLSAASAASASVLAVDVAAGGRQRYVYVTFASYCTKQHFTLACINCA